MEKDMSRAINLLLDSLNRIVPQLNRVEDDLARVQAQLNTTLEENRQLQYENEDLRQRINEGQTNLQTYEKVLEREKARVKALKLLENTNGIITEIRNVCCQIDNEQVKRRLDLLWTKFDNELKRMGINLYYLRPGDKLPQDKMQWQLMPSSEGTADKSKLNTILECQQMAIDMQSEEDGLVRGIAGYYDQVAVANATQQSPTQPRHAPEQRQEFSVQHQKPESKGGRQIAIFDDDSPMTNSRLKVCRQDGSVLVSVFSPKLLLSKGELSLEGSVMLTDSTNPPRKNATVFANITYTDGYLQWKDVKGIVTTDGTVGLDTRGFTRDYVFIRVFIENDGTVKLSLGGSSHPNDRDPYIIHDFTLTKLN